MSYQVKLLLLQPRMDEKYDVASINKFVDAIIIISFQSFYILCLTKFFQNIFFLYYKNRFIISPKHFLSSYNFRKIYQFSKFVNVC